MVGFTNAFPWIDCVTALTKNSFHVIPNLASFGCQKETDREPSTIPRNNGDMAGTAMQTGDHSNGFKPASSDSTAFNNGSKRNAGFGGVPAPEN